MDSNSPKDLGDGLYFPTRESPGYLLRRAHQLISSHAEKLLAEHGWTLTHWITLRMVDAGVIDTSASLARLLGHNSGATTRMLDQLEARGLLTRTRCNKDRRLVLLGLTAEGTAAVRAMDPTMAQFWNKLLKGFSKQEVDTLLSLLLRLIARLEAGIDD